MSAEFLELEFQVSEEEAGNRIDALLSSYLQAWESAEESLTQVPTRSKVAQWINDGHLSLNEQILSKVSHKVKAGDLLRIRIPPVVPLALEADSSIPIDVVFEDDDLLVLNKMAGLVVHPGAGQPSGTLINGLLAYLGGSQKEVGEVHRPGMVHRLDKDTSGLMVVAKTDSAFQGLVKQFLPPRTIRREYLAVTRLLPKGVGESGEIELPIGRHPKFRQKMAVLEEGGKPAHTLWQLEQRLACGNVLRLVLKTGRTHQIRVHLQALGAPIVGDAVYGEATNCFPTTKRGAVSRISRQALHACRLEFIHPISREQVSFEAPMAADIAELIEALDR